MMILSRMVASFRTHIVVRRPGFRDVVWKISCSGWTHCAPAKASALNEWRRSLLEAPIVLAENRPCLLTEINTTEMVENVVKSCRIAEKINKYAEISDFGLDLPKLSSLIG
jgi:hypothetical protein